jgi:ATP-dependent exoDNAse (exonuclease V) alpha subunit
MKSDSTSVSTHILTTVTRCTSHSSQGQTADRVLIHVDTEKSELLVNNRFAYVSVSRAQHDAHIYTNDGSELSRSLSRESSQRTATEVSQELAAPKAESVSQRGGTALRRGARS